jgi:hypothetical protein
MSNDTTDLIESGVPGVTWRPDRGKWLVQITVNRRNKYVGVFNGLAEAIEARREAARAFVILRPTILKGERITKVEITLLRETMLGILAEDHPQSVRHVFYRMTNPRLPFYVQKSEEGYGLVQRQLAAMREGGELDYSWIADATRMGWHVATYKDAADFVRREAGTLRADLWIGANTHCEVWTESRSAASVIRNDCRDLCVSLYPAGGFTSLSQPYEAAVGIAQEVRGTNKEIEIIYIGDYDRSGIFIDPDIENKLRGHLDRMGIGNPFYFRRLAVTAEQVADGVVLDDGTLYSLPTKPAKDEKRGKHITETVEAEAIPAGYLRRSLRDLIESFLPERALKVTKVAEQSEREGLLKIAHALDRGIIKLADLANIKLTADDRWRMGWR